jgi:PDZ domain-containing protein
MRRNQIILFVMIVLASGSLASHAQAPGEDAVSEAMKQSLVLLEIAAHPYDHYQPWKHMNLTQRTACGTAVGPYQVITTASRVTDTAFIRARRFGQNEYINAQVQVIDYDSNLCLLQLDQKTMTKPLQPLTFSESYQKGAEVEFYWLSAIGRIQTGRGFIQDHKVQKSTLSHAHFLNYIISNISQSASSAQLFFLKGEPIGIAASSSKENKQARLIPAERIKHFLADVADGAYQGFPAFGFDTAELLDPTLRKYLKMPEDMQQGTYVRDVHNVGTGCKALQAGDVVLQIEGAELDAHGRYVDAKFGQIGFPHLISRRNIGETLEFEIWRDGKKQVLSIRAENFAAPEMLVPYYEYDRQPKYIVTAGFVFQRLTRPYLMKWGGDWQGKVDPHIYHYLRTMAYKPSEERKEIMILSHVIPADINLGYHSMRQEVVKTVNGKTIGSIQDIADALKLNPDSRYDVIEFEHSNPTVVIDRSQLAQANAQISQRYGIEKLVNIQ